MNRRQLDVLLSVGGLLLAGLLVVAGVVLHENAQFAKGYVADQLSEQHITFAPLEKLTPDEQNVACLVENAGKPLTTGKQAECYANEFIGDHLKNIGGGKTYAELGAVERSLKGTPEYDAVHQQRETLFKGETLRGLLLTSYGFSEFGVKAGQASTVAYWGAFILFLLSAAGFIHSRKVHA